MKNSLNYRKKLSKKESKKFIKKLWKKFNFTKFSNKLLLPTFQISYNNDFLGAYKTNIINNKVISRTIIINYNLFKNGEDWLIKDVILHEMAHQYCCEILNILQDFHGNEWKQVCEQIGCRPIKNQNEIDPIIILK